MLYYDEVVGIVQFVLLYVSQVFMRADPRGLFTVTNEASKTHFQLS